MIRLNLSSRRQSLLVSAMILPIVAATFFSRAAPGRADGLIDVDYRKLVSRADLDYDKPASRSEEGMPIGNGRMGSLAWTTPTMLKFQINRVDVFAENCGRCTEGCIYPCSFVGSFAGLGGWQDHTFPLSLYQSTWPHGP